MLKVNMYLMFLLFTLKNFTYFSSVSIVHFEQVNVSRVNPLMHNV